MRLYSEESLHSLAQIVLGKDYLHYVTTVHRKRVGDKLSLFNGNDGEWLAKITDIRKKDMSLEVSEQIRKPKALPPLTLAFAPLKNQPMQFLIEKSVELGVTHLQPVITDRTVVVKINKDKILANAIESVQQCERLSPPTISDTIKFGAFLRGAYAPILVGREREKAPALLDVLSHRNMMNNPVVLIGPEGGFSDLEWRLIEGHPLARPFSLGSLVLRAETAAIAALSVVQAEMMRGS